MLTRLVNRLIGDKLFGYEGIVINFHTLAADEQLDYLDLLGRHFQFINHDEFIAGSFRGGKPFCLLTYDDGKLNNYQTVYPILKAAGVPALFYVTTGYLDNPDYVLWFDRYRKAISEHPELALKYPSSQLKLLTHKAREELIDMIILKYDVQIDRDDPCITSMSWEDAKKMIDTGFTIGAHSLYHEILTREDISEARLSILMSIDAVTRQTGVQCPSFCFPNGNFSVELAKYAIDCGVTTVTTTEPTWVSRKTRFNRVPRIQLHEGMPRFKAWLKIEVAQFPGVLGNPDGSKRSYIRKR